MKEALDCADREGKKKKKKKKEKKRKKDEKKGGEAGDCRRERASNHDKGDPLSAAGEHEGTKGGKDLGEEERPGDGVRRTSECSWRGGASSSRLVSSRRSRASKMTRGGRVPTAIRRNGTVRPSFGCRGSRQKLWGERVLKRGNTAVPNRPIPICEFSKSASTRWGRFGRLGRCQGPSENGRCGRRGQER